MMKLIVGLGNPGRRYETTRHNVGFDVVDRLAERAGIASWKTRFDGLCAEFRLGEQRCLLLKPMTYMNCSGRSVSEAVRFYRIELGDVLVICDDFNLPLGKLRIRPKGSAGGQKGLADVLKALGDQNVARLRIGVGPVPPRWDVVDFVLSRFRSGERPVIEEAVVRAAEAAELWCREGVETCMNRYNAG